MPSDCLKSNFYQSSFFLTSSRFATVILFRYFISFLTFFGFAELVTSFLGSLFVQRHLLHFFCSPKRNEAKKRAASNLFWVFHFFRLSTQHNSPRQVGAQTVLLEKPYRFSASKMSNFLPKMIWWHFKEKLNKRYAPDYRK